MKDNMTDKQLNDLADIITTKLVSNVKSMQAFIDDIQSKNTIDMLNIDEEVLLLGEVAKLYTIMDACKQDEMYEKCAVIKDEIKKVKQQLKKFK
jgi:protein-arginine kinase activator protein McsA